MTHNVTVNGVNRSDVITRTNFEWAESAYLGEVGQGRLVIDDEAGDIVVPGFKGIHANETASTPARIFTGFAGRKSIRRGVSYRTEASREYEVATLDGNDILRRHVLHRRSGDSVRDAGKRPEESVGDRVAWLLASGFLDAQDFGAVSYPDKSMDKADYRGQYAMDVLSTCAKVVRFNFYVRWNAGESDWELVFRDDNDSTDDTCTLSISNVLEDIDEVTVFPPFQEAELDQDPEGVYSGAYAAHGEGHVYEDRPATATDFTDRDGITEDASTRKAATARRDAKTFLDESRAEEQLLPVHLQLPADKVGLVQAGMRIFTRMSHMAPEGWDPGQYARILRLRKSQNTDDYYDLVLELSPQEEAPPPPAEAAIIQSVFGRTAGGVSHATFPDPVTIGSLLVFAVGARNETDPEAPNIAPSEPRWGADPWTKLPNVTINGGRGAGDQGVAIWYKTADATDQTCAIGVTYAQYGAWEISGGDIGSAVSDYKTSQAIGLSMDIGTLAATDGAIGIMIHLWDCQAKAAPFGSPPNTALPTVEADAGWSVRHYDSSYESWPIIENSPVVAICDGDDDGTGLNPRLTASFLPEWPDAEWCGAAILIPPA